MIVENDCLILQIFQMSDRETREEVSMNVMIHKPAEREAQLMQANREYKSLFGVPPMRDVQRLLEGALVSAG